MIADRYELEREVGRGGMGAVWLARDDVLGRRVAIKRIGTPPGNATPAQVRAEREGRLAAQLNHPHVVAVFDLVSDADNQWLVMEYVPGVNLSKLIEREGALSLERGSRLLAQVADALAAAHASGIVHRDVKPSNVLVTAGDEVKLSDFGIAKAEADVTLTETGLVTGSPAYLAPEVASGQSATTASDVWSLGATAFHVLSGRPPYQVGDNLLGTLYQIVHEEPPRLPDAGWLAPLLEATMAHDPADRWSMAQVRDFLAAGPGAVAPLAAPAGADSGDASETRLLPPLPAPAAHTESHPAPEPEPERDPEARHRRRRWLPIGAAVATVLLAGLLVWAVLATGDDTPPAATPDGGATASQSASSSQEPTTQPAANGPDAEGMETFIADYLATAPNAPQESFEMLTPGFQEASGGFGGYSGYWNTIESAELVDVTADPQAMTVAYTVDYVKETGESVSDDVVLRLDFRDGRYLIAAES